MPRAPRIHVEEGLYFITTVGDHGRELFKDDSDRRQYIEFLGKYKEQYQFQLYSYVLMASFVHLLIELGRGSTVSDIMHDINTTYTKYFNSRYERRGHLFRGRFRALAVEKDRYLASLTRYIHLVPGTDNYLWSSYAAYVMEDTSGFVDVGDVLRAFSMDREEAGRLYIEFMGRAHGYEMEMLRKKLSRGNFLGSKEFIENAKKSMEIAEVKRTADRRRYLARVRIRAVAVAAIIVLIISGGGYLYFVQKTALAKKDAEKKYQEEIDSYYKRMSKTLEIERQKAKALEKSLLEGANKK